jgi:hypothetical protein
MKKVPLMILEFTDKIRQIQEKKVDLFILESNHMPLVFFSYKL